MSDKSYHSVKVTVGDKEYKIFDSSYSLILTCTRTGGWELWEKREGTETLLGQEFGTALFLIEADGQIICDNRTV